MDRTRARLAGFVAVLGLVFVGGWAVGAQFPTDQGSDHPAHTETPADAVIAGCETHVCLLQTAVGLLAAGLRVFVVADACGSRTPRDHAAALERLRAAGAAIVTLEMVVFEWLQTCDHLKFREALGLVKEKPAGTEFRWDDASPR